MVTKVFINLLKQLVPQGQFWSDWSMMISHWATHATSSKHSSAQSSNC